MLDAGDADALAARFAGTLQFGTAGLRGALGGGPNRMNLAVVRAATFGLARWSSPTTDAPIGVWSSATTTATAPSGSRATRPACSPPRASRCGSRIAAWPTPVTAYAVRHFGAAAGVMVTASHNPARRQRLQGLRRHRFADHPADRRRDRGRASRRPGPANAIPHATRARRGSPPSATTRSTRTSTSRPRSSHAGDPRDLRVVYTPLHGVGLDVFLALWERAGFAPPIVVDAQAKPDPDFPTAPFPNPEEPGVLDLALDLARRHHADLVSRTIPTPTGSRSRYRTAEAGRSSPATRSVGCSARACTGADRRRRSGRRPVGRVVDAARQDRRPRPACPPAQTLTGFKWISRAGDADGRRLVFGYEEALGYAVTPARPRQGRSHGRARDGRPRGAKAR